MAYTLTIWLEIHCKLLTDSKVFCRCRNEQDFDTLPANTHICPVCMWLPGALPTISTSTVEKAAALGILLWCTQQDMSYFDRKSYFYPDLPMGYQITQFNRPLNIDWLVTYHTIDYSETKQVHITQAHIECDTAKTAQFNGETLLDFNRAGTPLIEVVTGPDFHTADEVHGFIREIQRTLKYNNISLAEMDKWQMRCDVNISVSETEKLWTRVEIKNMNSISAIKRAIAYEYTRQTTILETWESLAQETRWWDDIKWASYSMRSKENSLDYRYFPEPDLPTLHYTTQLKDKAQSLISEPVATKIERYIKEYSFHKEYINGILSDESVTRLFELCIEHGYNPKNIAKYLVNYVLAYTNIGTLKLSDTPFDASDFMLFLKTVQEENIPDNIAKQIIISYLESRRPMSELLAEQKKSQEVTIDIDSILQDIISTNQKVVDEYRWWKKTAIWFLIGQVMKKTWWVLQPQEVQKKLEGIIG
jgi:aspartyl-tRNA(Asn)/glutamyl-tRNA(Gln) amidotransferase subunit B